MSYGNLRRRILRALPTYQYPQQYFILQQPDILVQAGFRQEEEDHTANSFGNPYGMPVWLIPMLGMGLKAGQDINAQKQKADLAAMTAEAQLVANTEAAKHAAASNMAFQKRLPLIVLGLMAGTVLGVVSIFKFAGGR